MKHGPTTKLPCGCAHDDLYWTTMCADHAAQVDTIHQMAEQDRSKAREIELQREFA
jgi:hypothetical protein